MASPTFGPVPCRIFNTPSGKPASFGNDAIRVKVSGTFSEGFTIIQLPRAIAFGIVQLGTIAGKLNGTMDATTPSGTRSTLQSFRDAAGISVAMAQAKLRKVPPKINSQIGSGDQNFVSNPTQEQVC